MWLTLASLSVVNIALGFTPPLNSFCLAKKKKKERKKTSDCIPKASPQGLFPYLATSFF